MTQPQTDIPVRAPAKTSADDTVQPFEVSALDLRGRVVRLGPAVDDILAPHNYPPPVAKLLGEAVALTVLLGSALKIEGRFILQTQTDGPVRMLVVDFRSPGHVRACARFDAARVAGAIEAGKASAGALLGQRPSRHDHRPGRRHEPLPGPGRARRRQPGGCRARILQELGADPDPGAARGRRGDVARLGPPLAGRRHAAAVPAQGAGARAGARPPSRRRARRHAHRMSSPRTTPGSKAAP